MVRYTIIKLVSNYLVRNFLCNFLWMRIDLFYILKGGQNQGDQIRWSSASVKLDSGISSWWTWIGDTRCAVVRSSTLERWWCTDTCFCLQHEHRRSEHMRIVDDESHSQTLVTKLYRRSIPSFCPFGCMCELMYQGRASAACSIPMTNTQSMQHTISWGGLQDSSLESLDIEVCHLSLCDAKCFSHMISDCIFLFSLEWFVIILSC